MNVLASLMSGVMNLKHSTRNTKAKERVEKQLKQEISGKILLIVKLKQVLLIWSTKMLAIENQINRISAQSRAPIFAQKLFNIQVQRKSLSAI